MKRDIYRVRGRITYKPKIRYDYFSRQKVLIFSIGYTTYKNGEPIKHLIPIVIKDKLISLKIHELKRTSFLEFAKNSLDNCDIVLLTGYETNLKFKNQKKYKALNVIKFKILWSNLKLTYLIRQEIKNYKLAVRGEGNEELLTYLKDESKDNILLNQLYKSLKTSKPLEKSLKTDKDNISYMELNKNYAKTLYEKGDKYIAIARMWINKYIYLEELTEKTRIKESEKLKELIKCDFNKSDPSKYNPYPKIYNYENKRRLIYL